MKYYLSNLEQFQKLDTVSNIDDPYRKAELYKKVFGEYCQCNNNEQS